MTVINVILESFIIKLSKANLKVTKLNCREMGC